MESWDGEHDVGEPHHLLRVAIWASQKGNRPAMLTSRDVSLSLGLCSDTSSNLRT